MSAFAQNTLGPLLLRLSLAAIFIFHGLNLVGGQENGWGANWMKAAEAPPAPVQLAVAWGELVGGIALALGFLTRLAALGIIAIMAGAIATFSRAISRASDTFTCTAANGAESRLCRAIGWRDRSRFPARRAAKRAAWGMSGTLPTARTAGSMAAPGAADKA